MIHRIPAPAAFTACLFLCAAAGAVGQSAPSLAVTYKPAADRLISSALADPEGYANLTYLCDHIGKRPSGSEALGRAVAWSAALMRSEGLANVRVQPVMVPHWVRGAESGSIEAPISKPLHLLGLGMSIATPKAGITAPVVVVPDFVALDRLGRAGVEGKIVLFNAPYKGYGNTVMYRTGGPSKAAAYGAVAVLVRSITPLAMQLPHTGTLVYDDKQPQIPSAAISLEDALLLERLAAEGSAPKVHLSMEAHLEAEVESANVMGEIPGTEHPEEVVDIGGHLDSWDVGQGAQDDGSGIMATLAAVRVIQKSGLKPRRTIRIVFWVNEENGARGGQTYRQSLDAAGELNNHVATIEMDDGAEQPTGFGYGASGAERRAIPGGPPAPPPPELSEAEHRSLALLRQIEPLLAPLGAGNIRPGGGGSDIEPLMQGGVPGLGVITTGTHYFDWHHTEADTLDKVDPQDFRKNVASLAVMTYILADMPQRLAGHQNLGNM